MCFQLNLEPEKILLVLGLEDYDCGSGETLFFLAATGHVCLQLLFTPSLC